MTRFGVTRFGGCGVEQCVRGRGGSWRASSALNFAWGRQGGVHWKSLQKKSLQN